MYIVNLTKNSIFVALVTLFFVACSTDKNKFLNRGYHGMVSHYNGYWNAKENIRVALKDFRYNHKDNFDSILPLYIYPNSSESKSFYPVMDTSISKCATVIKRHAMPERKTGSKSNEEWNKWIDDNWLVIGQAHFYKRDYKKAIEAFQYISLTYPEDKNLHWSRLWMAKSYVENGQFNLANKVLNSLSSEVEAQLEKEEKKEKLTKREKAKQKASKDPVPAPFTKDFILERKLVETHLRLSQQDFKAAIPALEESIEMVKKRALKARLWFILGQIYQESGQLKLAGEAYREVEKLHPNYDMTFFAQINQVYVSSGKNAAELKSKLLKLSRDDKNIDYFDIIFYALADLELKEKNEEKGIKYLEKSIAYSSSNKNKSRSYLRLGDLYYKNKDYPPAQAYYDSTLTILTESHDRFYSLTRLNKSLKVLVESLDIIHTQDSLQDLANNFSEKEIIKKIEKMIDEKRRSDEKAARQQNQAQLLTNGQNPRTNPSSSGRFWAYDNQIRAQGYNDFKLIWGSRKNEDNWRRKNKSQSTFGGNQNESDTAAEKLEYTLDYYLKNVPLTEEKMRLSDSLLADAYYKAGTVFVNDLNEQKEGLNMFVKVNTGHKQHIVAPASHYQVYLIALDNKNSSEKNKMKDVILSDYPDSDYAKLLLDPDYFKRLENAAKVYEKEYAQLYQSYKEGYYRDIIRTTRNMSLEPDSLNPYLCQSLYLRAMSIGFVMKDKENTTLYEEALELVIKSCPISAVGEKAQNNLNVVRKANSERITTIGGSNYVFDADVKHYFIYVHERNSGRMNEVKVDFSNFCSKYFSPLRLTTNSAIYNMKKQLVVVKSFKNLKQANDFIESFRVNKSEVSKYNKTANYFLISHKNYLSFYKNKDLDSYMIFYKKNYK